MTRHNIIISTTAPLVALVSLNACDQEAGLSTAQLERAAKDRVATSLGLSADARLFTDVVVGGEDDGDIVLCGTVSGVRDDGTRILPRRFLAATEPARWVKFELVDGRLTRSFRSDWAAYCADEPHND